MRFLICCSLFSLIGCGPSPQDVVDEFRPKYDQLSKDLEQVVQQIPAGPVNEQALTSPLSPQMTVDPDGGNTEVIAVEELQKPGGKVEFDLHLDENLGTALAWMQKGEANSKGDPKFMRRTLQGGLDLKYLVVYRTVDYVAAKVVSRDEFIPATIVFENFVFDLETKKLLGTFRVTAVTPKEVMVTVYSDQSSDERIPAAIRSALWEDARKKLAAKLKQFAGATVVLD